jgi:hypothetical protein
MSLTRKLRFGSRRRVLNLCRASPLFQESTSSRASAAAVADVETGKERNLTVGFRCSASSRMPCEEGPAFSYFLSF